MSDFFQNRYGICFSGRILTKRDQFIKQFIYIGEIEITGEYQISGNPVVLTMKGVHQFDTAVAVGAVAQVTHQHFPRIRHVFFEPGEVFALFGGGLVEARPYHVKQIAEVVGGVASFSADVTATGFRVEFDGGQARAILPAIAHLLHQTL